MASRTGRKVAIPCSRTANTRHGSRGFCRNERLGGKLIPIIAPAEIDPKVIAPSKQTEAATILMRPWEP
jgi:hypothetical protein